jgi:hypothetical protein
MIDGLLPVAVARVVLLASQCGKFSTKVELVLGAGKALGRRWTEAIFGRSHGTLPHWGNIPTLSPSHAKGNAG